VAQVFTAAGTLAVKLVVLAAACLVVAVLLVYRLNVRADAPGHDPITQPIPFSHQHHVADDGIDCRYCHSSVETSAFAGIPPLQTCMTCHSQLFTGQPMLRPLVRAFRSGAPLAWKRVHDLPDFVYFDHSIHVAKGVGCVECHGQVDAMPLMYRVASLDMQWCVACHRDPAPHLRPRDKVFDMHWKAEGDRRALGDRLLAAYRIRSPLELTQCSVCHR
jgi:hypothetical protein